MNTGDTTAFIKAKVVVTWKTRDYKNVYGQPPVAGSDYEIVYANSEHWKKGVDGFYYFCDSIDPEESTSILIESCKQLSNSMAPEGYYLSVEVIASAVQATTVAVSQWSNQVAVVNADGTLEVKTEP